MTIERTLEQSEDKDYEDVFRELGSKLNEIDLENKKGIKAVKNDGIKKKSEAIIQSAIKLKAIKVKEGKPVNTVSTEIKSRLRGRVSSSLIDKCLGKECKLSYRSDNARKRKITKKNPIEIGNSATIFQLNQEKDIHKAITDNGKDSSVLEKELHLDHVKKSSQKDISVVYIGILTAKQDQSCI